MTADALLAARADLLNQGRLVGELAGFELRVDQLAVHLQLEAAPLGGDERQLRDLLLVLRQQLGRQTDGLWLIVSHRAIAQFQFHGRPPSVRAFDPAGAAKPRPGGIMSS